MKIGSMLAKIREKSGINQKKLGKKMGVCWLILEIFIFLIYQIIFSC